MNSHTIELISILQKYLKAYKPTCGRDFSDRCDDGCPQRPQCKRNRDMNEDLIDLKYRMSGIVSKRKKK